MTMTKTNARNICRHEACPRIGVHDAHPVPAAALRAHARAERVPRYRRYPKPWQIPSMDGLTEAVYAAVSTYEPRLFIQIYRDVLDSYGACCERAAHRHLVRLRRQGRIVRVDLRVKNLYAYLRAGSRLTNDPDYVCERILEVIPTSGEGLR